MKNFRYKLSNIDMKNIYEELTESYDEFPEVIVFEELEDDSNYMCCLMPNGHYLIYLKNAPSMLRHLIEAIDNPRGRCRAADPFEYHNMGGREIHRWVSCAVILSNILGIRCPQIIFTDMRDAGNAAGHGAIFLPDSYSEIDMLTALAHELRHEWQYFNHPEWNDNYVEVKTDDDLYAYYNHVSEIDAEAFARKFSSIVFDVDAINVDLQNGENLPAIVAWADKIKINIVDTPIKRTETNIDICVETIQYLRTIIFGEDYYE